MSDSRKDKELILPPPVNSESDGLRVKEAVANKEKEAAAAAASSSSSTALTDSSTATTSTLSSTMEVDDSSAVAASSLTVSSSTALSTSSARTSPKKTPKKSMTKCACCNKKTGLNGFVCRCGDNFCALHRLPEKHACTFDFQTRGKESIQRDNPLVQRAKVTAI